MQDFSAVHTIVSVYQYFNFGKYADQDKKQAIFSHII